MFHLIDGSNWYPKVLISSASKKHLFSRTGSSSLSLRQLRKAQQCPTPLGLADGNWPPPLPQAGIPLSSRGGPNATRASHFSLPLNNKLLQHVSLTSKQILIDYSPSNPKDPPRDKSIKAQRTLRGMFNVWIDINNPQQKRE